MKYGLLLLLGIAALLLIPLPVSGHKESEFSLETGLNLQKQLTYTAPDWEPIVTQQLARKAEQDKLQAEAIEKARQAQIEAARAQEQARQAQLAEQARKARQTAPKRVKIATASSSMFQYGSCVWFVAQKRAVGNWGNANQWLANARAAGFATGNTPQVGAIAWTGRGALGHVAYVIAVNGNQVTVQDSNYAGLGVITTRLTSASEWVYIY